MSGNFSSGSFSGAVGGFSVDRVSTGGGLDGGGKRRRIVKPTGLVDRPRKTKVVEDRVEETRAIHDEVVGQLSRELGVVPISGMTLVEVDREIGVLLREVQRDQEEDMLILLMMSVQ